MEAIVRTKTVVKPTHVTVTMSFDEAQLLLPFLGQLDLNVVNRAMNWGTHNIVFGKNPPTSCTCGKSWPCEDNDKYRDTNEAIFQLYSAFDITLRKFYYDESR